MLMAHNRNISIQLKHIAQICKNDMIQIKNIFQIVATWLQFSTEEYLKLKDSCNIKAGMKMVTTLHFLVKGM